METTLSFGTWLRQRRRALDLTQPELVRQAVCGESTIRKLEAGDRRPPREMAQQLVEILDTPADERAAVLRLARQADRADDRLAVGSNEYIRLAPRPNVPIPLINFIGRERELFEIAHLLSATRLLTLKGTGGCGKRAWHYGLLSRSRAATPTGSGSCRSPL